MKTQTLNLFAIVLLAILNTVLYFDFSSGQNLLIQSTADLRTMNAACYQLRTNTAAMVKKANQVGFASALFGYSAREQGMETEEFVALARQIYGHTNMPDVHILAGTNEVEIDLTK